MATDSDVIAPVKVHLSCCMCMNSTEVEVQFAPGWVSDEVYEEKDAFCPDHAAIEPFTHDQCPGCVGSWGGCPLFDAFAYSHRRSMTEADFTALEHGRCPKRVNGTFTVSNGQITDLDISDQATDEAGSALAQAIRDYIERWPD